MRLRAALAASGYRHQTELLPPPGKNGVIIAARYPFREHGAVSTAVAEPYRMVAVEIAEVRLCGIYMPNLLQKVPYWEALIGALAGEAQRPALAIGDFNTCRAYVDEPGAIDATAHFLDKIEAIGFCDLWRRRYPEGREFSWYSTRGNGFRIDHAFLSPALAARAQMVRYSHEERLAGLSDHSPLILDVGV
jgi:exonuclease III